jgi:hypothetical protein
VKQKQAQECNQLFEPLTLKEFEHMTFDIVSDEFQLIDEQVAKCKGVMAKLSSNGAHLQG